MAKIVAVHGIGWQLEGEDILIDRWVPALRSGLRRAGVCDGRLPAKSDVVAAFYGHIFRGKGKMAIGEAELDAADVDAEVEAELLSEWWREAAAVDQDVRGEGSATMASTPRLVQRALEALSHSKFFAGLSESAMIWDLKQVRRYFSEAGIRRDAIGYVVGAVREDSRILIAHSLGSVVAYEALCAHPEWPITTFVSLGSPLGIANLVFDRLAPPPEGGVGRWPGSVRTWINVADRGDVVALVKQLSSRFGERVRDIAVDNESRAHDAGPYLTAVGTGEAIAAVWTKI